MILWPGLLEPFTECLTLGVIQSLPLYQLMEWNPVWLFCGHACLCFFLDRHVSSFSNTGRHTVCILYRHPTCIVRQDIIQVDVSFQHMTCKYSYLWYFICSIFLINFNLLLLHTLFLLQNGLVSLWWKVLFLWVTEGGSYVGVVLCQSLE